MYPLTVDNVIEPDLSIESSRIREIGSKMGGTTGEQPRSIGSICSQGLHGPGAKRTKSRAREVDQFDQYNHRDIDTLDIS